VAVSGRKSAYSEGMADTDLPTDRPRNVIDYFQHTETLLIKGDLDEHRRDFILAFEGFQYDFNCGGVLRNANAFLARETLFVGGSSRQWDRRGSVGTYHYEHLSYMPDFSEFKAKLLAEERPLVILEDTPEALPMQEHSWDERSCILVGAEGEGVSKEILEWVRSGDVPGAIVYIEQLGSVRSLNASVAAGIACFHYSLQHPGSKPPWVRPQVK